MYFKTEGLILRETDYKEADKLLTVLTQDRGKVTLRARGVKRKNSPLKSACQLLAFSEFTVFENKGRCTVDEAAPREMFLALRSDIELLSLASYFAQVAEVLAQEDDPNPALLSLCLNALFALSRLNRPQSLVKSAFELRAACLAGYEPMLSGCAVCGAEQPDRFCASGMLQCASCQLPGEQGIRLPLHPGTLAAMRYIVCCSLKKLFSFQLGPVGEKELAGITETYLLTQLERGFFTLDFYKSLKIT